MNAERDWQQLFLSQYGLVSCWCKDRVGSFLSGLFAMILLINTWMWAMISRCCCNCSSPV